MLLRCYVKRNNENSPKGKTPKAPKIAFEFVRFQAWSSLVEGGEGSYLPNCQTTLVIALDALFLLFVFS